MIIRNCQTKDLPGLIEIWTEVGLTLGLSDTIPELEKRLTKMGVVKINLWIEAENTSVIEFYRHLSYQRRNLITMSKILKND
ncbi:hypothetical protein K9N50_07130 [bacterium]|nr:hypothetical protein [bacterium]